MVTVQDLTIEEALHEPCAAKAEEEGGKFFDSVSFGICWQMNIFLGADRCG
jgi:hypothetical protein